MKGLIRKVLKEETDDIDYVWYFYDRFLNRQPIEFEGLFLEPTYDKKNDIIIWDVANPNDYSYSNGTCKFNKSGADCKTELVKDIYVDGKYYNEGNCSIYNTTMPTWEMPEWNMKSMW